MEIILPCEKTSFVFFKRTHHVRVFVRGTEIVAESNDRTLAEGARAFVAKLVADGRVTLEEHRRGEAAGRKFHYATTVAMGATHPRFLECLHRVLLEMPDAELAGGTAKWQTARLSR